ncbi:OLC1v1024754C1 [Oldenlandia corymbosa var. corymbosa]|uniref:OLC1v1024754C1 n=1 Tax=Oldenlandia corymbosa var. corymbosa TaxID=529605 RepID=A0AAV1C339_OLDCO|nr:OLC1v1024754C1 [Oldenlandia corymbosa var. corymbosa]
MLTGHENKPQSANHAWKTKETEETVKGKENNQHKDGSTSGLTETEKKGIPTDIGDSSPLIPQDKRLLSKERLSAILETNSQEENLKNTWEDDDIANYNENTERQLVDYKKATILIPPLNLSSRFDNLVDLSEDQPPSIEEEQEKVNDGIIDEIASDSETELAYEDSGIEIPVISQQDVTRDDGDIGNQESDMEDVRLVVSNGEDQKKKRGRPRGSTKIARAKVMLQEPMQPISKLEELRNKLHFTSVVSSISGKIWVLPSKDWNNDGVPWVVGGDYNVIRNLEEYEGSSQQDMGALDEFNDLINDGNLLELPPDGNLHTWKGMRQNGRVLKRLDRLLFTQEWLTLFPVALIHHLNRSTSDHAPLLLQYKAEMEAKPRLFRFQKMWLQRNNFLEVVKENWEQPIDHHGMLAFSLKLRRLKARLKEWNKVEFGDVFQNLKEAEEDVRIKE